MKSSPLLLALFALALTAGRASAFECAPDLAHAGPHGELCTGGTKPPAEGQPPTVNPAAAAQLTNMAGGVMGSIIGNALVSPLPNQYQGHQPVKPIVGDDDGIKTPGTGAAGDIIGDYKPQSSYDSQLAHFRALHDDEMDKRRAALEKLKGTSAEKWCAAHIGILFPEPPVSDIVNSYPNKVRAYDREKQTWDQRCGGPSQQVGYQGFDDELAALKPDAKPAPSAVATAKAPTYEAPAPPPSAAPAAEPEKPAADSFADAEKELESPPAKKTTAPTAAPPTGPPAAADAPDAGAQAAAPDATADQSEANPAATADDSANTNHATEFFGQKNAKVTAKDLADTRAPELTDPRRGGAPGAPAGAGNAPGTRSTSGSTGAGPGTSGAAGVAAAPSLPAAPGFAATAPGAKAPPAAKTPPAKKKRFTSPAKEILDLIKESPTFYAIYKDLRKQNYHFVYGPTKGGTYINKGKGGAGKIVISEDQRGDANALAASLAHEFGHSRYKNADPDVTALSRDDFVAASVKDQLADEGEATLVAIKIKKELKDAKGPEIEIPGVHADDYQSISDKYPDAKDHAKAREEIGNIFADGERPSTDPGKTYKEYYTKGAEDYWDSVHPKAKSP